VARVNSLSEQEEERLKVLADELARMLPQNLDWNLFVTILWIGSRDLSWTARKFAEAQTARLRTFTDGSAGDLVTLALRYLSQLPDEARHVPDPEGELLRGLANGEVSATGFKRGVGERCEIPRLQWIDLHFPRTGPEEHIGQCCAYAGIPTKLETHFWSRITFDRTSVMKAFPAPEMTGSEVEHSERTQAPERRHAEEGQGGPVTPMAQPTSDAECPPRPGEDLNMWALRAEEVATQRLSARGEQVTHAAVGAELEAMAKRAGVTFWTAKGIVRALQRERKAVKEREKRK
jgi:hypothetical protein